MVIDMSVSINVNSGLTGVQKGLDGIEKAASQLASKDTMEGADTKSIAEALIDLKVSERQVAASAQVVKAVDDAIGTLLDIKA